jgi:hypothetical protein
MTSRLRVPILIAVVALAGGCATTMNVSSHTDRSVDFARYGTYDWGPAGALPTGDPRLDKDPFFKDVLQGAVEKSLAARGLALGQGDEADLLIHYHASVSERLDVNQADSTLGYCPGEDCRSMATRYEAGTIVVDFVDTRSNRVVWRGWIQDRLESLIDDRERMAERIGEGVTRMLAGLPSGSPR